MSSSNANNSNQNRFTIFEEDDEEDDETSEASVSTSVVLDAVNNRSENKGKVRHEEEDEEEKESDWENYSHDDEKNNKKELITNELCQSVLRECKSLEEHVVRLDNINDETSCFGFMHQCHLSLMRNKNNEDWEIKLCECNELFICNKK